MNIFVVGNYKQAPSEGMEVITASVVNTFKSEFKANVHTCPANSVITGLLNIVRFNPDVVVFTHGPGTGVLLLSRLLKLTTKAKIVWVASRPLLDSCPYFLQRLTHVDHILTNKPNSTFAVIQEFGSVKLHEIIIGIDYGRLADAHSGDKEIRNRLLGKSSSESAPLIIHVGHIRQNRGLENLIAVKRTLGDSINIAVIGSPSLTLDQEILDSLDGSGIAVCLDYIEDLSAIYRCADCYIFPVDPASRGAVELPLSVIESLACGTPVISTPFGVLPKVFNNFKGIKFSSYENIATDTIESIISQSYKITVDPVPGIFDLANIARKIIKETKLF